MNTAMNDEPTLYILMRNDMESMSPGKACAQASHATDLFERQMNYYRKTRDSEHAVDGIRARSREIIKNFDEWQGDRGFGKCIVLGVNLSQMMYISNKADRAGVSCEMVIDPTYPVQDGQVVHHVSVPTCMYIFAHRFKEVASLHLSVEEGVFSILNELELY